MKRSYAGYFYIVLCAVIFSTVEAVLKTVTGVFAPMQITVVRFLVGGVLLIPFALRSLRQHGAHITRADVPYFLLTGFLCVALGMVLYQMAIVHTRASVVAVIFSSNSIFTTVLASLLLGEKLRRNHIAALALVLLAILIIVDPLHAHLSTAGVVLSIVAAVAFAFYSVVGKKRSARFGGITVTCMSFLFGSAQLLLLLLLGRIPAVGRFFASVGLGIFADVPIFRGIPASALPALAYICAISTAGGYVCHMLALEKTSAREAALIFFLKPIIAPIFALILLHEEIPLNMILGILCFLIGSGLSVVPGILEERRAEKDARTKKE